MSHRLTAAVVTAAALWLAGCGHDGGTSPTPSQTATPATRGSGSPGPTATEPTAGEPTTPGANATGPQQTLNQSSCTDLTGANLELAIATTAGDAKRAADVFAKYHPPSDVQEAVDHFVSTKGAQPDDPEFAEDNRRIDDWVKAVCPQ